MDVEAEEARDLLSLTDRLRDVEREIALQQRWLAKPKLNVTSFEVFDPKDDGYGYNRPKLTFYPPMELIHRLIREKLRELERERVAITTKLAAYRRR